MVWSDHWIPDTKPRPAIPCGPSFNPNLHVYDLIDLLSPNWNLPLLHQLLSPRDISLIQSLRLPRSRRPDNYNWAFAKSGAYSVQSGYNLALEMDTNRTPPLVSKPSTTSLKAKVWSIKTSRKIKHFIWNALSDYVPVCGRLSDRHCSSERNCPR